MLGDYREFWETMPPFLGFGAGARKERDGSNDLGQITNQLNWPIDILLGDLTELVRWYCQLPSWLRRPIIFLYAISLLFATSLLEWVRWLLHS